MDEKIGELFQSLSREKQEIVLSTIKNMLAAKERGGKDKRNAKENIA